MCNRSIPAILIMIIFSMISLSMSGCEESTIYPEQAFVLQIGLCAIDDEVDQSGFDRVSHGWLTVDSDNEDRKRLDFRGEFLETAPFEITPGFHTFALDAVDQTENILYTGAAADTIPSEVDPSEHFTITIDLVAVPPVCSLPITSLDFGTIEIGHAARDTFLLANIGFSALPVAMSFDCNDFSLVSGGALATLTPGQTDTVVVEFSPTVLGSQSCSIDTGTDCGSVSCVGVGAEESLADLVITSLTHMPESPTADDQITFTAVIKNAGNADAEASRAEIVIGSEVSGSSYDVPALSIDATYEIQRSITLAPGSYDISATADIDSQITESDENNNEKTDSVVVVELAPIAPSNLAAVAVSTTRIDLSWVDNADNETGFRVQRSPGGEGSYDTIATLAENAVSIPDSALSPATTYWYRVLAFNGVGESAPSVADSATTFSPELSTLIINPEPNEIAAPWLVTGPDEFSAQSSGDSTFSGMTPGDYTVSWGAVDGWETPAEETLSLLTGETVTFDGTYIQQLGTITINTDPDNYPWSIAGPNEFSQTGSGDTSLEEMIPGSYTVIWGDVEGWFTPASSTQALAADGSLTFDGIYMEDIPPVGTIIIDPNPNDLSASWSLEGPDDYLESGNGDTSFSDLATGDYTVSWGAVAGWDAPEGETLSLTADAEITFEGTYVQQLGTITISSIPTDAPFSITGPNDYSYSGRTPAILAEMVPGSYTITWGAIEGYIEPPGSSQNLLANGSITFEGTYTEYGTTVGTISIDPNPDDLNATWLLEGPEGYTRDGDGDELLSDLSPGSYSVSWSAVSGWETPGGETLELAGGGSVTFVGEYVQQLGTVQVDPDPDELNAPWTLEGPLGYENSGAGDWTMTDLIPGSYTITWGPVVGWNTPDPETLELLPDATLIFASLYTSSLGTIIIDADPDVIDSPWEVNGDNGYENSGTGDLTLSDMIPGSYTIFWNPVADWDGPPLGQETQELAPNGTVTFTGVYTYALPRGTIEIVPEPDDISAPWTIDGPYEYHNTGIGGLTLIEMIPGDYNVVWGDVSGWATPPMELRGLSPSGSEVFVGTYTMLLGSVEIDPNPDHIEAPWDLVGPNSYMNNGTGDDLLIDMIPGSYTLTWGAVPNWSLPDPEVLELFFSETITFASEYNSLCYEYTDDLQDWTLVGALDPASGNEDPHPHNFVLTQTSIGNEGYLDFSTPGGHGIPPLTGDWWIMQMHSPSLVDSEVWQDSEGYTALFYNSMTAGQIYANLYVRIFDHDMGSDRYFYSGTAEELPLDSWYEIDIIYAEDGGFPVDGNYTVEEVFIDIFGQMSLWFEGTLSVDDVCLIEPTH